MYIIWEVRSLYALCGYIVLDKYIVTKMSYHWSLYSYRYQCSTLVWNLNLYGDILVQYSIARNFISYISLYLIILYIINLSVWEQGDIKASYLSPGSCLAIKSLLIKLTILQWVACKSLNRAGRSGKECSLHCEIWESLTIQHMPSTP